MSGKTEIETIAVLAFAAVAAGVDLAFGRIFNWLTVGMAVLGIGYCAYFGGLHGVATSVLGILAGFGLYIWMFWLGILGGGDVKLLMALGAWGGAFFALNVAVLGIAIGGAMGLVVMIATGRIRDFLKRLYRFLLTISVRELEPEAFKVDKRTKMPFGLPIAAAVAWVQLRGPIW